jgi:acetyltransferase-like isoleucine patch superfamily enzyme
MDNFSLKFQKLLFKLTPARRRSPFLQDNPWFKRYDIGEWTYGRPKVLNWGAVAKLRIGRFCAIANEVTIYLNNGNQPTNWVTTFPFGHFWPGQDPFAVFTKGDVTIGNDVWIGEGATILSGVSIGNGAVIGTRAVVVKSVPAYSIAAGNPARVLRERFSKEQIVALEKIAWWDWPVDKITRALPLLMSSSIEEFIRRYECEVELKEV